ncbi:type VI secretion system contractile sheath domain-containing protein [Marinospirillum perlucidum]|uniref:type VI secretion system contractile sheath domain-containing protein n=1 Tax=Marinospirillum perlucidum TaxID=1982602 RepID=UPI000DF1668B|nr:type VI secretion system contractile sheath large subunit [Marinospirillum perlucidum]
MPLIDQSNVPLGYRLPPGQSSLPCRLLVIADLGADKAATQAENLPSIDAWLAKNQPLLELQGEGWSASIRVGGLYDLEPSALLAQLQRGAVTDLEDDLAQLHRQQQELFLVNRILHHPRVRQLEASWRSLDKLLKLTRSAEQVEVSFLHMQARHLQEELTSQELEATELFDLVYSRELGQYGGEPYSALVVDAAWTLTSSHDLSLLANLARLGQMAHLPVITSAAAASFGLSDFNEELTREKLQELASSPRYMKFRQLAATPAARYLLLAMPRVLLRPPYQEHLQQNWFQETPETGEEALVWGNAAYPLAGLLLQSFNQLGAYTGLLEASGSQDYLYPPLQLTSAQLAQAPLESQWSQARVAELTQAGLTAFVSGGRGDALVCEMPVMLQAASQSDDGVHPDNQLVYLMTVCRVAHYLKQAMRELIGSSVTIQEVENGLNQWLQSIVSAQEKPTAEILHRKPFRSAEVRLARGETGAAEMQLQLQPHLKYQGESFALSLVAELPGETHG